MQKNQQLINLCSNAVNLLSNILIGLFFTPYLVSTLGISAYGVLPLALLINSYINVVTGALIGSMSRFYSIELVAERYKESSEYLSIAFISLLVFSVLLAPLAIIFILNIDMILNIPNEYIYDSQILFIYMILSFLLSMCSSLLNITQFAMNRLDIMNAIKIGRNVFKVIFILIFFSCVDVNLINIGFSFFLSEIMVFVMSYYFFRRETNENITISYKLFDKKKFKVIIAMIFWVLLLHIGEVVLFRIDNLIINIFWSTTESGIVGMFSEFGMYINSVLAVIISLSSPLIVINYSKHKYKEMISIFMNNYIVTNYFLCIMISIIICYAPEIIRIWLGNSYTDYSNWFCMKILFVPFVIYISIYNTLFRVYNKLRLPSYIMIICGIIGVILMCIIGRSKVQYQDPVSLVLVMGIISLILNFFTTSIYLSKITHSISVISLFKPLFALIAIIPITYLISLALKSFLPCENFFFFLLNLVVASVLAATMLYKFALPQGARSYIIKDILSRRK